ncbi:precorrin-2 dehydrogenase SirC [Gottschalkia acidurici 9a]|uniref:precorrin-2 dehydrogenase n=1 Tax=Gottschalkia acidurici (strain ATCC 7906 / DSM 604 / BCRC 14475 / CIP 104303 / KCTC 5404 / NCIMB 10678 / 9a) TaxID=1128398 RepID=K0B0A2_GOTA9|nr:NAD(P)-dependent oxidoreductase [Gottschalkia acidurici]AFS79463.1 precorrin-2 dehydrogenase SirC [Gottschalkia acidurici 9a]
MSKNNKEDILLDYALISLISSKIKVIIIGGGKGGYIKAKSFLQRGCSVYVLSKEFDEKFKNLRYSKNIIFINESYKKDYIKDKHIVIISTNNPELNNIIKQDCEENYKLYLMSSDFKEGLFVTPTQRDTRSISIAINTKVGSPKTSVFLAEKMIKDLSEYDDFVMYVGEVRKMVKEKANDKKLTLEIMEFLNTDDFYFFIN